MEYLCVHANQILFRTLTAILPGTFLCPRCWSHGWEEELELNNNGWDIPAGTTDLYWNMTDLNIGERYSIYFYAYVDNEYVYSNAGDTWYATSDTHSWHFDFDEESSCDVWGYGTLRIWNDGSLRNLETVYFYADEPCIPPYDLLFEDATSSTGWSDSTTSTLPEGTIQMMFDLSSIGHGDYEVDYYWHGDKSGGHGWYYDNQFTVNETIDGYYWNMTLDDEDAKSTSMCECTKSPTAIVIG